jgi:hypothetical protein
MLLYAGTPLPVSGQITNAGGARFYTVYGYPEKDLPGLMGMNPIPEPRAVVEVRAVPNGWATLPPKPWALRATEPAPFARGKRQPRGWGWGAALAAGLCCGQPALWPGGPRGRCC